MFVSINTLQVTTSSLFFNKAMYTLYMATNNNTMKEFNQYLEMINNAEEFLQKNCWVGTICTNSVEFNKIKTYDHQYDQGWCRAIAPKSLTAKEIFDDIMENNKDIEFVMMHPNGTFVSEDSF